MYASSLISSDFIPLKTSDTGEDALSIMADYNVSHLPIVNDKQLLGLISQDDVLLNDINEPVGSYPLSLLKPFVYASDHIFDVMKLLGQEQLTVIPVIDRDENYLGLITEKKLMEFFANTASFTEPGSLIVLEIPRQDYSLAQISQIVESEGSVVLSSFVTTNLSSSVVDVTIKVRSLQIHTIIASLERYGYSIKATFQEEDFHSNLQDNYDALISYLNM